MSHDKQRDDDFAGLGRTEARELEETAEALRAERHVPEDPAFWSALEGRIMNEVEVTPIAGQTRSEAGPTSGWTSRFGGWLRRSWRQRLTRGALAVVVVTGLVLLILSKDRPPVATEPTPSPDIAERDPLPPQAPFDGEPAMVIPDALWQDGFLANGVPSDEALDLLADDEAWYGGDDTDRDETLASPEWAAFDWPAGEASLDALAADYDWGLAGLDEGELEILAELLDG